MCQPRWRCEKWQCVGRDLGELGIVAVEIRILHQAHLHVDERAAALVLQELFLAEPAVLPWRAPPTGGVLLFLLEIQRRAAVVVARAARGRQPAAQPILLDCCDYEKAI